MDSLATMRAHDERYRQARMLSATVNSPLSLDRPMPVLRETRAGLLPAPSREPCRRCNIRGDIGCKHQAAFVAGERPPERLDIQGKRIFARHRMGREGVAK